MTWSHAKQPGNASILKWGRDTGWEMVASESHYVAQSAARDPGKELS